MTQKSYNEIQIIIVNMLPKPVFNMLSKSVIKM